MGVTSLTPRTNSDAAQLTSHFVSRASLFSTLVTRGKKSVDRAGWVNWLIPTACPRRSVDAL